ncbi:MAG: transcriptional regulator, GntR family [Conexibacter sp.]|nr:transcriptional regulator, GntR family [Conexibacter sp.]
MAADAYSLLRAEILSGELQPSERLVEADLTARLGVSRGAVRTALVRLQQEGLVEHERHRGARVRLVGEREAAEILEARMVLEGLAARHAAARATPEDVAGLRAILADMRERLDAGDLLGVSDRNAILHARLLAMAGHATVDRLVAGLRGQLVRFQYRTILVPGRSDRSFAEHTAIVDAVAAGDADAAEAAMLRHLGHVTQALRESPQRNSASTAAAPNPTAS